MMRPHEEMDRRRLSRRQMTALKAFHSGSSLTDAAKAGVTRQTLHRWRYPVSLVLRAIEDWEEGESDRPQPVFGIYIYISLF